MKSRPLPAAVQSGDDAPATSSGENRELVRGVGFTLLLSGAGGAVSLALSVVLARVLGAEGYGIFAYSLAIVTLLAVPAEFGAGTVLIRFCAAYEKQGRWALLNGLLQWANKFVLVSSLVLTTGAGLVLLYFPNVVPADHVNTMWWALILLPVLTLGALRAAALRGFRHFVKGQIPERIVRPAGMLLMIALLTGFSHRIGPADAMVAYVAVSFGAFCLGAWWLWRVLPDPVTSSPAETDHKSWRGAMMVLSLTRGGRVALNRMDLVFIGSLAGAEAAGIYRVASALAAVLGVGLSAINTVVAPYFSRLNVSDQPRQMKRLLAVSCAAATTFAVPVIGGLLLFGDSLITVLYGTEFAPAFTPLAILSAGHLFNVATGPVGTLANMTGEERWTLLAIVCSIAVAIPAYMYMVPRLGVVGAAVVAAGSLFLYNGILSLRIWSSKLSSKSTAGHEAD